MYRKILGDVYRNTEGPAILVNELWEILSREESYTLYAAMGVRFTKSDDDWFTSLRIQFSFLVEKGRI